MGKYTYVLTAVNVLVIVVNLLVIRYHLKNRYEP